MLDTDVEDRMRSVLRQVRLHPTSAKQTYNQVSKRADRNGLLRRLPSGESGPGTAFPLRCSGSILAFAQERVVRGYVSPLELLR
jgi:hypothetical protein